MSPRWRAAAPPAPTPPTSVVKPGDSSAAPTTGAAYYDAEQPFRYLVTHAVTDPTGDPQSETLLFYDGMGRKIQVKQESVGYGGQQIVSDTRYDGLGRVVAQSQPRYDTTPNSYWNYLAPGATLYRATRTSYDALGRTRDVSAPDGATTSTAYAPTLLDAALDANGHRSEQIHDSLGRLTKVRESDSAAEVFEAEDASLSHLIGSAQSGTWLSPATSGTRSQSNFLTYGPYRVPPVAGPGQVVRFRLAIDSVNAGNDAVAQIQVNDADGGKVVAQRTLYRYDFPGGLDQWREFSLGFDTTSLAGHHLEYRVLWLDAARMAHDRTVVSWSQALLSTVYRYDGRDLLTGVTDANGNITSVSYDSAGRKIQMTDPDMGAWSYAYDVNGNLTSQTDARNITTSFGYDALDRLTSQSFSDGTPTYYLGYDDASVLGIGHQTSLCSATPSAACGLWQDWRYDGRGRATRQSQGFDGT